MAGSLLLGNDLGVVVVAVVVVAVVDGNVGPFKTRLTDCNSKVPVILVVALVLVVGLLLIRIINSRFQ
jgi:hypothetical protein